MMRSARDWRRAPIVEAGSRRLETVLQWLRSRPKRAFPILVLAILVLLAVLYGVSSLSSRVLAKLHLHSDYTWYDFGFYGLAPAMQFKSFASKVPRMEFLRWDARCSQDSVFFGWRGHDVEEPAAVILGADRELVWRQKGWPGDKDDIKPQMYKGERFLTFYNDESAEFEGVQDHYEDYYCWFMVRIPWEKRHNPQWECPS
jgi:hypothetical protein